MKGLIEALRDYVTKGDLLNIDYFIDPGGDFSHPWMYGDDLNIVRAAVIRLGIAK